MLATTTPADGGSSQQSLTCPGLAPVATALAGLRSRRGPEATRGLAPGLHVADPDSRWVPASALVSGERLDGLLDAAKQRWGAALPAAVALAWRSYTYWLAMPVVLGWVTARRVPLLDPDDVLVQVAVSHSRPLLTLGVRRCRLAMLSSGDSGRADVTTVTTEEELLHRLRTSLRDAHLDPLMAQLQTRARLGTRTLLGSLASAVGYAVVRGLDAPPHVQRRAAERVLAALDVADLVSLDPGPGQRDPVDRERVERDPGDSIDRVDRVDSLTVRRRTCCLAFTLPEPKLCSGCCVPPAVLHP